jgi:hypothetical protein
MVVSLGVGLLCIIVSLAGGLLYSSITKGQSSYQTVLLGYRTAVLWYHWGVGLPYSSITRVQDSCIIVVPLGDGLTV